MKEYKICVFTMVIYYGYLLWLFTIFCFQFSELSRYFKKIENYSHLYIIIQKKYLI